MLVWLINSINKGVLISVNFTQMMRIMVMNRNMNSDKWHSSGKATKNDIQEEIA